MSDTGDNSKAKVLAEMKSMMQLLHEELKSRATSVGTNPLEAGITQPPVTLGGIRSLVALVFAQARQGRESAVKKPTKRTITDWMMTF